jgi:hypothetical protein
MGAKILWFLRRFLSVVLYAIAAFCIAVACYGATQLHVLTDWVALAFVIVVTGLLVYCGRRLWGRSAGDGAAHAEEEVPNDEEKPGPAEEWSPFGPLGVPLNESVPSPSRHMGAVAAPTVGERRAKQKGVDREEDLRAFFRARYLEEHVPVFVNDRPEGFEIEANGGVGVSGVFRNQDVLEGLNIGDWLWVIVVHDVMARGKHKGEGILTVFADGVEVGYVSSRMTVEYGDFIPKEGGVCQAHVTRDGARKGLRVEMP